MSDTVKSTVTDKHDEPIVKKPRLSAQAKAYIAGAATTTLAIATVLFVKSRTEDDSDKEIVVNLVTEETLTDLTTPTP